MKTQTCCFSGFKIQPGFGKRFIRGDMKTFIFFSSKTAACFFAKRNPPKCPWTIAYRITHKKDHAEETIKKRVHRVVKTNRPISGITPEELHAKRTQKPEVRKAAREAAQRELNERKKALREKRAAERKEKGKTAEAAPKNAKVKATKGKGGR